ncbi:MAG: asparaginase [Bacteroidetes bacterium]|nr:MAG: asparaginase [Bacteroidota bacterium]REK49851.1 MAG: asparaginase [Bacteroidota bacterium]
MRKIALIYTGGTIGMRQNPQGKLAPMDFESVAEKIPALKLLPIEIVPVTLDHPIDSSEMVPAVWQELAEVIDGLMDQVDGMVVLHGTDTMAYTACALSFMFEGLQKPIIITGSQLPVGVLRTDAVENIVSAFEFAALAEEDGSAVIREVAIYFEYELLRGNRAYKRSSNEFNAFSSPNYPPLASSGVRLSVNKELLWRSKKTYAFKSGIDTSVGVVTLYPGLDFDQLPHLSHWKVLVLRTFGAGNAPKSPSFLEFLKRVEKNGTIIVNTSQCVSGSVLPGLYDSSSALEEVKMLNARDMTFESALVKSMVLLGQGNSLADFHSKFPLSLAGEVSE